MIVLIQRLLFIILCVFVSPSIFSEVQRVDRTQNLGKKVEESNSLKVSVQELRKIQKDLQSYKYLALNFQQSVYKKLRNKVIKNNGEVYFKKPSSFHWKFTKVDQEEWIYDGQTLMHFFPKKNEAYRYKAQATKGKNLREIVDIILNFDRLLERYTVFSSERKNNNVYLKLVPKERGEISQVELSLNTKANYMNEVILSFEGGNKSTFSFSNPRNKEVKSSFLLPPKIKILEPL